MEKLYVVKRISQIRIKIDRVFLEPGDVEPMEEAVNALEHADLIVLGRFIVYECDIESMCEGDI